MPQLFTPKEGARADLRSSVLYAIDGGDSYIYYGQVAPDKSIGFFRFRSSTLLPNEALASEVMSRFLVIHPSIGQALREGIWVNLGLRQLRSELADPVILVQWPVGTLDVTIWKGGSAVKTTKAHDPEIQTLEIFAAHDAIWHVPQRIKADFERASENWSITSNVRHERHKKEALARLNSDKPWHALHPEWVSVDSES